ncbi:MAG: hypothetical protein ACM3KM_01135 [Acidobacteriaceae bacterium]
MQIETEPIFDENNNDQGEVRSLSELTPRKRPKRPSFMGKKVTLIILIGLLLAVLSTGLWYVLKQRVGRDPLSNKVEVVIQAPDKLPSGNEIQYTVTYANNEKSDIKDATLLLYYPSNFRYRSSEPQAQNANGQSFSIPILKKGEQGQVKVTGELIGKVGDRKEIKASLRYRLANFNSDFSADVSFTTELIAARLNFEISGAVEVTDGQDSGFSVNYSNISGQDLNDLAVKLTYPQGFSFITSTPPASRNNDTWLLGDLKNGTSGKIDISGTFTGDPQQERPVVAELGMMINNNFATQISKTVAFKIVPSPLSLVQQTTPKDFSGLGGNISYKLNYTNNGSVPLSNVIVSVVLTGPAIDFAKLKIEDAIVSGNKFTWKSATVNDLALLQPNESGSISFTVPIKGTLTSNLANLSVKSEATVSCKEILSPVHAQPSEIKIESKLGITSSVKYVSGSWPMRPGQSTIFSVSLMVNNMSNEVEDVLVVGSVPLSDSAWTDVIQPESEKPQIEFDPGSNKFRWEAGKIAPFAGRFNTPAKIVTFQLAVVPNESDVHNPIALLKDVQGSGNDTYVGHELQTNILQVSTKDVGNQQGTVAE